MKQPKQFIGVRLDMATVTVVDRIAKEENKSRSQVIRDLLMAGLRTVKQ